MKRVRVEATPIVGRDLQPGDLFSVAGPEYWARATEHGSVGEAVYVRTNAPAEQFPDPDLMVYRIKVIVEEE